MIYTNNAAQKLAEKDKKLRVLHAVTMSRCAFFLRRANGDVSTYLKSLLPGMLESPHAKKLKKLIDQFDAGKVSAPEAISESQATMFMDAQEKEAVLEKIDSFESTMHAQEAKEGLNKVRQQVMSGSLSRRDVERALAALHYVEDAKTTAKPEQVPMSSTEIRKQVPSLHMNPEEKKVKPALEENPELEGNLFDIPAAPALSIPKANVLKEYKRVLTGGSVPAVGGNAPSDDDPKTLNREELEKAHKASLEKAKALGTMKDTATELEEKMKGAI